MCREKKTEKIESRKKRRKKSAIKAKRTRKLIRYLKINEGANLEKQYLSAVALKTDDISFSYKHALCTGERPYIICYSKQSSFLLVFLFFFGCLLVCFFACLIWITSTELVLCLFFFHFFSPFLFGNSHKK